MVDTISKEQISGLPIEIFEGRIIVISTLAEAEKAASYLKSHSVLGFDTETRPAFKKGQKHEVALLQLSTQDTCFLFRLNLIGFPPCVIDLLTDNHLRKIGLSLKDDFSTIRRKDPGFDPQNFVELQTMVPKFGIKDIGLQRVYAILFGKRISKSQRLTNWEAEILSDAQKMYASIDAWACLQVYNKLSPLMNPTNKY